MGISSQIPRWVGLEGEGLLPLLALISNTTLYEDTWSKIQEWAVQFGLTKLKAGYRGENKLGADYVDPDLRTSINLAFAGQGSRQMMPVITQLFWALPDSLIMIEEPELSLHPEAQIKLRGAFR
jgi:predicted ATPase